MSIYDMDGRKLRRMPVESANWISDLNFPAGQRPCLENLLVPESGVLIWFFRCGRILGCTPLVGFPVLFNHKTWVASDRMRNPRTGGRAPLIYRSVRRETAIAEYHGGYWPTT
jgi:hypothetical protein